MGFGSGNVIIRNRKIPIVWTGQFAEHVATTFIKENSVHRFLHIEIQKMCQKAEFIKQFGTIYKTSVKKNDSIYTIVGELHSSIFYPKTCYKTE